MHNLRHFYYQNKEKIWKVVLIVAFILGIIYFLNYLTEENEDIDNNILVTNQQSVYKDEENKTYISNKSLMSGQNVTESEAKKIDNTVSKFLEYCKNENFEQAYEMLSTDCKQNEFNNIQTFKERYASKKFDKNAIYEIEKWINDTYKVSISKDILSTGKVNNEKQVEYITIVNENSEQKLNIDSYIGQKKINKEKTQNNVKITAVSKKAYIDYEIYNFTIENLSNKTIKLDSLENIGTMYLVDSNDNRYHAYTNEILEQDLEIKGNHSLDINIKYANPYSSRVTINKIVFENIILDYIKYMNTENLKSFQDTCKVEINL